MIDVNIPRNRILLYSAIKSKAKLPLLYSVLKPDTNSDSLSAKSKGGRFVSAAKIKNHIAIKGNIVKNTGTVALSTILVIHKELSKIIGEKARIAMVTS